MGDVLLCLVSLSLLLCAPFGVLLVVRWVRPVPLPEPYVRYRPDQHPAVLLAELEVRLAYPTLAPLYDTPAPTRHPAR